MSTVFLTFLTMVAFAANSVLCRWALSATNIGSVALIDPVSFTFVRLLSGAMVLVALVLANQKNRKVRTVAKFLKYGSWRAGGMLWLYAMAFSWAYLHVSTATGALLLFGAVQITMVVSANIAGEALRTQEKIGLVVALSGLIYLLLPNVSAPPFSSALIMFLSGAAWGMYTRFGQKGMNPLNDTAANFVRAAVLMLFMLPVFLLFRGRQAQVEGVILAALSGGIASGLGYALWYSVLRKLTTAIAASVQLSVPVIAALGGLFFVSEPITWHLVLSSVLVLGGIAITLKAKATLKA